MSGLKSLTIAFAFLFPSMVLAAIPTLPDKSLPVPIIRQATDYSCGAASLSSILHYWKVYDGDETSLFALLETDPKEGTEPQKIVEGAKHYGLSAYYKENMTTLDLELALARGDTVIIDMQAWPDSKPPYRWKDMWEDGHYVVLIAMDEKNIYLMDPSTATGYVYVPLKELMDRWHDYESRHGYLWKYYQLGIVISGKHHMDQYPAPLKKMN